MSRLAKKLGGSVKAEDKAREYRAAIIAHINRELELVPSLGLLQVLDGVLETRELYRNFDTPLGLLAAITAYSKREKQSSATP